MGSQNDDDIDSNCGSDCLYQHDSEPWNFLLKLISKHGQLDDHFGQAVANHENNIAILSYYDDTNGSNITITAQSTDISIISNSNLIINTSGSNTLVTSSTNILALRSEASKMHIKTITEFKYFIYQKS